MTTVPNPSAPPATPPAGTDPPPTPKFAGKYATDADAHKGVSEIRKQVGLEELPTDKPLYGENGHFRDRAHAETQYKEYERIYHATRSKPAAAPDSLSLKPDAAPEEDNEAPESVLARANIKPEDAAAAIAKGSLTDEQIAAIRKAKPSYAKLGKDTINMLAQGHYAKVQAEAAKRGEAYAAVSQALGGEDKHTALREWAKQNVPQPIRDEWSAIVEKNPGMYQSMMNDVAARHAEAIRSAKSAPLANGTNNAGPAGIPTSRAEFTSLMNKAGNGDVDAARVISRMTTEQMNAFN